MPQAKTALTYAPQLALLSHAFDIFSPSFGRDGGF